MPRLYVHLETAVFTAPSPVERSVVLAHIYYIAFICCRRLFPVESSLPLDSCPGARQKAALQRLHGQRGYLVGPLVIVSQSLQYAFIYRPCRRETEGRVEPVLHVAEVLVAEQLQNHRGHRSGAALAVALVPDASPVPVCLVVGSQVLYNLGLHVVAQKAADEAVPPVGELPLAVAAQGIDGKRAYGRVCLYHSGIGVESKRKVDGDALLLLHHCRPYSPGSEVVGVVVVPVLRNRGVGSRHMHIVMRPFCAAGHPRYASSAFHLAVSAAELDRVSAHHIALLSAVCKLHIGLLPGRKLKSAQIDPGSPSHLLVHFQFGFSAQMPDCILGAFAAVQI